MSVKAFTEKEKKHSRREDRWRENAVFTGACEWNISFKRKRAGDVKGREEEKRRANGC